MRLSALNERNVDMKKFNGWKGKGCQKASAESRTSLKIEIPQLVKFATGG
jgi:hypothetical protein